MYQGDFDYDWEGPEPVVGEVLPDIDFATDLVVARPETEMEADDTPAPEGVYNDNGGWLESVDLDSAVVEFVDLINARDLDSLADILAADVEADFLNETGRLDVMAGLGDLFLRYPTLVVTRGHLGSFAVAAAWLHDADSEEYDLVGYFTFDVADREEIVIQRLEYVEGLAGDPGDLVVETPEATELPEWEDWSAYDET